MLRSKVKKFFRKRQILGSLILLFIVVAATYGTTSLMYFGQDDHGLMFKLQNIEEGFSQYGEGITGRKSGSPYRYMVVPFAPLYPIFGINPLGYFTIGVLNYFLATVAVYFLALALSNRKTSLISGLIFAAGYVGSDTMLRLTNSYQIPHAIIFICLTVILYKKYIDSKKPWYYVLTLTAFLITTEGFWIRSHGLLGTIIAIELLYNLRAASILRMAPFTYVYWLMYIKNSPSTHEVSGYIAGFLSGNLSYVQAIFRTISNLFLVGNYLPDSGLLAQIALVIFTASLIWTLLYYKKRLMWFGLAFVLLNFMVYMFHFPERAILTTHRYSTIPFVGVSLFLGSLATSHIKNKKTLNYIVGAYVIFSIIQMNSYSIWNLKNRNIPTRNFYKTLTTEIPSLPKQSAIFFDVREDEESRRLRSEFFSVGSAPEMSAIAYYYNIDRYDLYMPEHFDELLSLVDQKKVAPDNVYTFYFDAHQGLINTTQEVKKYLFSEKSSTFKPIENHKNINLNSSSPAILKFKLMVSNEKIPYNENKKIENLNTYLEYLSSKEKYYSKVVASASSSWKYQGPEKMIDNEITTGWMGDRFEWADNHKTWAQVELPKETQVGAIKKYIESGIRTPTKYEYFCSQENQDWKSLGKFQLLAKTPAYYTDLVASTSCKKIRINIYESESDDSPQINELEIINEKFKGLDWEIAEQIRKNPYLYVSSPEEKVLVDNFLESHAFETKICFKTNKQKEGWPNCKKVNIKSETDTHEVVMPAGGTTLESFSIAEPKFVKFEVSNVELKHLNFKELRQLGIPLIEQDY